MRVNVNKTAIIYVGFGSVSAMTVGGSNLLGKTLFLTLLILTVLAVVASYLLVLLMGYGFIFFTSEGVALSTQSRDFPVPIFFFLIGFNTPGLVGPVFLLIWIVYILCFVAAWKWRESFHSVLGKSLSRPFRSLFSNFLFIMPVLSSMLFTAAYAIVISQEAVGVPTGQPSFPPNTAAQEIFLNLAYAPVAEELGSRLVPMGLFTILYVFLAGRKVDGRRFKLLITSILYPDEAKRMTGLRNISEHGIWRGISGGEWTMIIVTSVIFGFAHVISPLGWEFGKFTSVFVQGFFFAVAYLAYGFEAPILLHWFFNYYLFFFDPAIASQFFPTTVPILSAIELVVIGPLGFSPLGVAGWAVFAYIELGKMLRWRKTKQQAPVATLPS